MSIIKYFIASSILLTNGLFAESLNSQNNISAVCLNDIDNCQTLGTEQTKLSPPAKKVAKGNADFAFEFYKANTNQSPNIAISPFSASSCLAMVAMIAEGDTLQQIQDVLHFPKYPLIMDFGFRHINESLKTGYAIGSENVHLTPSNSIWTQKGVMISPALLTKVVHFWDGIQETDFINDTEGSIQAINDYVEDKTAGQIKDFLPEGTLDPMTRMVAINTLYLRAPWKTPFNEALTQEGIFHGIEGDSIAYFMEKVEPLKVGQQEDFKLIEIPFQEAASNDTKVSLIVILPNEGVSIDQVEKQLDRKSFRNFAKSMETQWTRLKFPKVDIEETALLKPLLIDMGLTLPFSPQGGFNLGNTETKMVLTDVIQTVKVDFNEWGTVCSAGTGAIIGITSINPTEAQDFTCDRPFIFLVMDKTTKSILFMGRISQPNE